MKDTHEKLLYIAYNLVNQNQIITTDAIKQILELMPEESFDPEKELPWLTANGFLHHQSENTFTFTDPGKKEAFRINQARMKDDFNRLINRATSSLAYLDFCEELYGYRMYLFNMMDQAQLDYLFNSISISTSDTILDLGCGAGNILDHLIKQYGCRGIGIDQLNQAIIKKTSQLIKYLDGNIDTLSDYHITPDITLSIDSLYFSNDLDRLIMSLRSIKNNRLYLYYSQYIFDETEKDRTSLECDQTRIARLLQKNAIPYQTVDYSANEHALYENGLKILPKYKKTFESESLHDLYVAKLTEYKGGKDLYDKGLASRYLYIVE
jgi:SAM-dependent methyltransferase